MKSRYRFGRIASQVLVCGLFGLFTHLQGAGPTEIPGQQADGAVLLPNQWKLRPVGRQIVLGDFPVNMALHPDGKFAAILHCGYGQHEIIVVNVLTGKLVSRAPLDEAFYGLVFADQGRKLFCGGAGSEVLHGFTFLDGYLSSPETVSLRDPKQRGVPAGLALAADAQTAYVANVWGHSISVVNLAKKTIREIPLGTNAPMNRARPRDPTASEDETAVTKRAEALLEPTRSSDPFPYACVIDEKQNRLYVSLWAQSSVAVIDLRTAQWIARWPTGAHPNEMVLTQSGRHLLVANANHNTVSVLDTATGQTVETLVAELQPNSPPGSTPNSLALSPDEKLLFVANANINTVVVFDFSEPGKSRSLGFIPVGWYPTSVRVTLDGRRLLVANGKGLMSRANRHGPQPGREPPASVREYIGGLLRGTLGIIDLPANRNAWNAQLKQYTARAFSCMPSIPQSPGITQLEGHPIPAKLGDPSPIQHVIYILKENRTYDQVLGDLPQGNGDPSLCLFPEKVTPNHHALAREFVLLDNFYVDGEVSADGHEWSMGAYATDFVEKSWPLSYGHNGSKKFPYPAEGNLEIATPAGGYLWDRAREAGISYRSYGEFVRNAKTPADPATTRIPALQGHFDPFFRSFDTDYPDAKRADRFIAELERMEREGDMPRLQIVRLPNDHTVGTTVGKLTPTAMMADNDQALGRVIQALSHSKFWPKTAIFVVEDDAQNGPDHVDAHRTVAFVISPYIRRGAVDSTLYSTTSMLRTMELILGLKPMSQFDAAAQPMFNSFQNQPDPRPFVALPVTVDLWATNARTAWGGKLSARMNFAKEDAADDLLLNEVIWRSVRGDNHPMPAPVRAAFVFTSSQKDKD